MHDEEMNVALVFEKGLSGFWGEIVDVKPYRKPLPAVGRDEVRLCMGMGFQGGEHEEDEHDPTAASSTEISQQAASVPVEAVRIPELPSIAVQEEHALLHLPPATWCPECVAGRARDDPHTHVADQQPQGSESLLPVAIHILRMW